MGCGKQEVFGVMGTSIHMNCSSVFGISSKEEHCKGQVSSFHSTFCGELNLIWEDALVSIQICLRFFTGKRYHINEPDAFAFSDIVLHISCSE